MKSERFNLRMTPKEKATVIGRAKRAGRTTSEFMIDTALNRKIIVIDSLPEMVSQLKALGRNLNQLVILCNMVRYRLLSWMSLKKPLQTSIVSFAS